MHVLATGARLARRVYNAAIHGQGAPRHVTNDHDPLSEAHRWKANLRILGIDEVKTANICRCPTFVERLISQDHATEERRSKYAVLRDALAMKMTAAQNDDAQRRIAAWKKRSGEMSDRRRARD
jgi:hypothetical protein